MSTSLKDLRVRITEPYPNYSPETVDALRGKVGTIITEPDDDGDVQVRLDESIPALMGLTWYARRWEALDAATAGLIKDEEMPTQTEAQLESLIDAVYEVAKQRGYTHLLAGLFESADIPMRPTSRTLTVVVLRPVDNHGAFDMDAAAQRMRRPDTKDTTTSAAVNLSAWVKVTVPWPEVGEHVNCDTTRSLLNANKLEGIDDDVVVELGRALGLNYGRDTARRVLTEWLQVPGASVRCDCNLD